jgi:hypothetical protein
MPERKIEQKLENFQLIIQDVIGNLTKANCPIHGKDVYFERVEGDLFQCANYTHKPGARINNEVFPENNKI